MCLLVYIVALQCSLRPRIGSSSSRALASLTLLFHCSTNSRKTGVFSATSLALMISTNGVSMSASPERYRLRVLLCTRNVLLRYAQKHFSNSWKFPKMRCFQTRPIPYDSFWNAFMRSNLIAVATDFHHYRFFLHSDGVHALEMLTYDVQHLLELMSTLMHDDNIIGEHCNRTGPAFIGDPCRQLCEQERESCAAEWIALRCSAILMYVDQWRVQDWIFGRAIRHFGSFRCLLGPRSRLYGARSKIWHSHTVLNMNTVKYIHNS